MEENEMKILIGRGCRSDYPLSDPIIKRMNDDPFFEVHTIQLEAANYLESYILAENLFNRESFDLVLVIGDRIEAAALAQCAFMNNIKICHYGAGITNNPISTLDDILRHNITLQSTIQLCEDWHSANKVDELFACIKDIEFLDENDNSNAHIVGSVYLDDMEVDESLVPNEPYDLVLFNPTTMYAQVYNIKRIRKMIIIGSNPDRKIPQDCDYDNLPRPQFLGLMKNCQRYITNSSSAYYEAELFLRKDQIIMIGDRNKNRSTVFNNKTGASNKIIKIIKKWWNTKNV